MAFSLKKNRPVFKAASRIWYAPPLDHLEHLSSHAPQQAGDKAFALFCRPLSSERREARHTFLVQRARPFLALAHHKQIVSPRGEISTYIYDPPSSPPLATVLIAHGWTAEASFMALFAERLRHTGFRAILMDAPAHGTDPRRRASLIDYAESVLAVADAYRPQYAIAHSMGSLAVLHAGAGGPPFYRSHAFQKYVLVSPPNKLSKITQEFAQARGMSETARRCFERHLERIAYRPVSQYSGEELLLRGDRRPPTLLIHARDDKEVPIINSEEMQRKCPNCTLLAFEGLGHRRILSAPPVVRAAVEFLRSAQT